jgi:MinD superfamily P-loop ATPase
MNLVILSGKGGTGKTTVATNLAYVAGLQGRSVAYLDCDVEEPNGHLFLHPLVTQRRPVTRSIVVVDTQRCNACGRCELVCQFSALVRVGKKLLTYPHLCSSCGACVLACPHNALIETPQVIGHVETGHAGTVRFAHGILSVGQARSTTLVRAVKADASDEELTLIDGPPGASCAAVETLRNADRVLLVCEPTRFGVHDAASILQLVQTMAIPAAMVINRCDLGSSALRELCHEQAIPVFAEIPEDLALARAYAEGRIASQHLPKHRALFEGLLTKLAEPSRAPGACRAARQPLSMGQPQKVKS